MVPTELIEAIKSELVGFIQDTTENLKVYKQLHTMVSNIIDIVPDHADNPTIQKTIAFKSALNKYITKLEEANRIMKSMLRAFEVRIETVTDDEIKQNITILSQLNTDLDGCREEVNFYTDFFAAMRENKKPEDFHF